MQSNRYVVICIVWLNLVTFFQIRVNMNVAILEIASKTKHTKATSTNTVTSDNKSNITTIYYTWTQMDIFQLLGSFFYGYTASQFPGSILVTYIGPKQSIAFCLLLNVILVLLTPTIEPYGAIPLTFNRLFLGLLAGPLFAATNLLIVSWSTTKDRSIISSITYSGILFGIAVGYIVGGFMCNNVSGLIEGWKYYFYFSGCFTFFTFIVWVIFVRNSPNDIYSFITTIKPLNNLSKNTSNQLLKPLNIWLQTFALFGHLSIFFALLTSHAKFLQDIYKLTTRNAAFYSIVPFTSNFIILVSYPILIDYLRCKRHYNTTKLRKISSCIAFTGSCTFIMLVGFMPTTNPLYAIAIVSIGMAFLACNNSGFMTSSIEIAPKFSGIIIGINNTFASTTGFIIPLINGAFVEYYGMIVGWRYTFILIGVTSFICGLPYVILGSSDIQPWA